MEQSYDIKEGSEDGVPYNRREIDNAKLYLQKYCHEVGDTFYNHLSEILNKILAERPKNPFTLFNEYSNKLKDKKFRVKNDYLKDIYVGPSQLKDAKILVDLFKEILSINKNDESLLEENESEENEDFEKVKINTPNLTELFYYFEQVDVGLPRAQVALLNLGIRKLVTNKKIKDVRFWGKILGRPENYYVVEAKIPDYEIVRRLQLLEEEQRQNFGKLNGDESVNEQINTEKKQSTDVGEGEEREEGDEEEFTEDSDTLKLTFPLIPVNTWQPPPKVFSEKLGTGVNAKIYFVCNSPGLDDWIELPEVTPEQIVISRQIVHVFTGNLESQIYTFPPFPGCEKNYLRAQIARIGAATQVSPIGYYCGQDDGEEGEEEEDEQRDDDELENDEEEEEGEGGLLVPNRHYTPLPIKELTDSSNWCHHVPYILKQGREKWLEPGKLDVKDDHEDIEGEEEETSVEEEEVDEEKDESKELRRKSTENGYEKEIGPSLLRPLSEDMVLEHTTTPAWTGRLSSTVQPDASVALIRSNVWPGAFAFAANKKFGNVYIGWGHKHNAFNYTPPVMPEVQEQYVLIDNELTELQDPSFEEEEAYRIAHLPPEDDGEEDGEDDESEEEGDTDEEQV